MEIKVNINEYDFRHEMEMAIAKAIREDIEPKVSEHLKKVINDEAVAKIIEDRIQSTLRYGTYNETTLSERGITELFNARIVEISKRITDQELKDFLFEAILNRVRNK